jgi:hypothetical protein
MKTLQEIHKKINYNPSKLLSMLKGIFSGSDIKKVKLWQQQNHSSKKAFLP